MTGMEINERAINNISLQDKKKTLTPQHLLWMIFLAQVLIEISLMGCHSIPAARNLPLTEEIKKKKSCD